MEKRWIWPFELLDKLGEGGMGVVYRARYVVDNRHVAVKLLPADIANETILSRFERELEILKTLRHPNIVRCFGGVCEGNQHFYAMELVEGGTLDKLLEERERFPWETAVQFALQMASGLSYAHERGIVHRDVKPGNFLLTPGGKLRLSDFGLAMVHAATKITAAGKTMGTFPYMAPEQIRGRPPISPQTDLYALGCVIFEMLTGRTPFIGETPAEVMHKHLDSVPPRVAEFAADCPMALESLVRDLLQKDPNDRPESAYIVAQRLMDVTSVVEVMSSKSRVAEATSAAPALRGLPAVERAVGSLAAGAGNKWVVPTLIGLLIISAAWNLRSIGTTSAANRAEELWIQAFRQPSRPEMRDDAAKALGEIGQTSPSALDPLIAALNDERPFVRLSAALGLTSAGAAGRRAVADLMRVQKGDDNELVRRQATTALQTIEAAAPGAVAGESPWGWILLVIFVAGGVVAAIALRAKGNAPRNGR